MGADSRNGGSWREEACQCHCRGCIPFFIPTISKLQMLVSRLQQLQNSTRNCSRNARQLCDNSKYFLVTPLYQLPILKPFQDILDWLSPCTVLFKTATFARMEPSPVLLAKDILIVVPDESLGRTSLVEVLVVTLALERGVPVGEQVDNFSTRSVSVAR